MMIRKLVQIQKQQGLTDVQMGEKLGIHPISWNRLKKGRSGAHDYEFLRKVVRAYPVEMGPVIVRDLLGEKYEQVAKEMFGEILREMAAQESRS